jgi:clan AA aspartic protease
MISGLVTEQLDAILGLSVRGEDGPLQQIEAVIDTGFSGELTLPPSLVESLGLPWLCRQEGVLADGQLHTFDVYAGTVVWGGEERTVEVESADTEPPVGMALLAGNQLNIEVCAGGDVKIEPLK